MRAIRLAVFVASALGAAHAGAATYAIGGSGPAGSKPYATLAEFSAAVTCLEAGDRVLIGGGVVHQGTLRLSPCQPDAQGTVTIQGTADTKGRIVPAVGSPALGLDWAPAPAGEALAVRREGVALFVLGPLKAPVLQVDVDGLDGVPAAAPDQGGARAPRTLLLSTVRTQREGCNAWMCLGSDDPAWARQVQAMAGVAAERWPELVLRNSPWSFTRHRIAAVDGARGEVRIAAAEGSTGVAEDRDFVEPGFGAMFVHGAGTLDRPGEWVFDEATRRLFLAMPAGTAAADLASRVRVALDLPGRATLPALAFETEGRRTAPGLTLVLRDLDIAQAAGPALRVHGIGRVEITRNRLRDAAEHGIHVSQAERVSIVDNQIEDTGNNGILVTEALQLEVRGNRIRNAGRIGVQPALTMQFNGLRATGFVRADIRENDIAHVGFAGIMLGERGAFDRGSGLAPQLVVAGNTVAHFCQMLNDCGAIYINGGGKGRDKPDPVDPGIEKRVVNNRIADPEPNLQGLPAGLPPRGEPKNRTGAWVRMVGAVYLDHGASGYDVRSNTVAGEYTPFGWAIFNGGIENACTRQAVTQCKAGPKAYRCYTDALAQCNQVPPNPPRRPPATK